MKYVIFQFNSIYMPVIFPQHVTHAQLQLAGAKPVSAGFFAFRDGQAIAYGESESMKLKANTARDSKLIQLALRQAPVSMFLTSNFDL